MALFNFRLNFLLSALVISAVTSSTAEPRQITTPTAGLLHFTVFPPEPDGAVCLDWWNLMFPEQGAILELTIFDRGADANLLQVPIGTKFTAQVTDSSAPHPDGHSRAIQRCPRRLSELPQPVRTLELCTASPMLHFGWNCPPVPVLSMEARVLYGNW
ncbi:hypothetical protein FB45DRAFT_1009944 [Roridomyces roridus]|uniref:Secreted protein n=1 Tax=Roridomyces roridus TaxID=1738132 RepID=A0AAD7B579_9AGAR|nr:hypothetical protein FB45DRAFT_1009944 [Roridomyces roridus]